MALLDYHDAVLYESDVRCFLSGQWLNDSAINFCFRYFEHSEFASKPFLLFVDPSVVSYFKLQHLDSDDMSHLSRRFNVPSRSLLFVPCSDNLSFSNISNHWSLLVVDAIDRKAYHFDSSTCRTNKESAVITMQRLCLVLQWEYEHPVVEVPTPQQSNGYDCGVFMLLITKYLAMHVDSQSPLHGIDTISNNLMALLHERECTEFRDQILSIVRQLSEEYLEQKSRNSTERKSS